MSDITKEELRGIVFVAAHNSGELSDQVQASIDDYDLETYRYFLDVALDRRANADAVGGSGGGVRPVGYLAKAKEHLEYILSH